MFEITVTACGPVSITHWGFCTLDILARALTINIKREDLLIPFFQYIWDIIAPILTRPREVFLRMVNVLDLMR